MARFIVTTSKAIDSYLDALPEIENKEEDQLQRIEELQAENKRYETEILELIAIAGTPRPSTPIFLCCKEFLTLFCPLEAKVAHVRASLSQIAQDQLALADGS